MKSTISKSQCCNKQQANSTTAHSNDNTDHSVADTLPMYASNSVHHMPMDISPSSTLLCPHHAVLLAIHNLLSLTVVTTLYTPMGVHALLIWPMSPTNACNPSLILSFCQPC